MVVVYREIDAPFEFLLLFIENTNPHFTFTIKLFIAIKKKTLAI